MAAIRLKSPLFKDKNALWLKGNLHMHTTRSDGKSDPDVMIAAYAKRGYDFLMLSDHDVFSELRGLNACGMVLLPGNELGANGPHLLDIGAKTRVEPHFDRQRVINAINRKSGSAVLCHPNWTENFNHWRYEQLLELADYAGIEIFNGVVLDMPGSHLSLDKWDRLLGTGKMVWGYANDDAHRLEQIGRGWNVVRARSRTRGAILDALRKGSFYASSGVVIETLETSGAELRVVAPNADEIAVFAPYGRRVAQAKGREMRFDASDVAAAFIRVECYGRGAAAAWTQPIMIRGGRHETLQKRFASLATKARPTLRALRASRAPSLTGKLDDPLWKRAPASSTFMRMSDGEKPEVKTEVRVIATTTHLYLGARCEEPFPDRMRLRVKSDNDGSIWADDSIEFFLDVTGTAEEYAHIQISAKGYVFASWSGTGRTATCAVRTKAGTYEKGWTIEAAIPLSALGAKIGRKASWGFHVCRNRSGVGGNFLWSWTGSSNHCPERFGRLVF